MSTFEHSRALLSADEYCAMSAHDHMSANTAMGPCSLMLMHAPEFCGTMAP